jgi:Monomeric isocitrate dehydrogenase
MNLNALKSFVQQAINEAKEKNVLLSAHLKATMMKVSDPIIFGAIVETLFQGCFHEICFCFLKDWTSIQISVWRLYLEKISGQPEETEIKADIDKSN